MTSIRANVHRLPRLLALGLLPLAAACGGDEPDAYGNFEANEVVVSAEFGGQLARFEPEEGGRLAAGAVVGQLDTVSLALQRAEVVRQGSASRTRTAEAEAQIGVLRAQLATAREELARTRRLYHAEAATAQQLNLSRGEVRVLEQRIEAARAQTGVAREEAGGAEARVRQIEERLARSRIVNPMAGTVLTTYAEPGEFVQPGAPLYKIADLSTLTLRAYVGGGQLPELQIGQAVGVQVDGPGGELRTLPGRVVWIASEAEFTPTPIQTRDERADQVYAVKVRVPNADGLIKVGMAGELVLSTKAPGARPLAARAPSRRDRGGR
jgi:HlyD family secretion protein